MDSGHEISILFYIVALVALAFFFYNCRRFLTVRVGKEEKDRSIAFLSGLGNAISLGIAGAANSVGEDDHGGRGSSAQVAEDFFYSGSST